MPTVGTTSKPAYVYDAGSDTWIPIGPGEHSHSYIPNTLVDAKGDILTATAADTPARLAAGTNGQYLSSNSSTATGLEWVTASSGGMTLLETLTLSGASVTSSSISQSYKNLQVIIRNARPSTNGTYLGFRMNGATTGYASESATQTNGNFNGVAIYWGDQISSGTSYLTAWINIYDYTNTTTWKTVDLWGYGTYNINTANWSARGGKAILNTTSAITTITLFPDSGNWTSGSALIYGVS